MIEKAFAEFVQQNLVTLDELARRYAEYRNEITQGYWDELRTLIQKSTPTGYCFEGVDKDLLKVGERVCGWSRALDDHGSKATIGFGVYVKLSDLSGACWPLASNNCWTGLRVWANTESQNALLQIGRQQILDTEQRDSDWLFWRRQPLGAIELQDLHTRLTEAGVVSREEILKVLKSWRQTVDPILSQLPRSE